MNIKPILKDYVTISLIGKGTYAKVFLVRNIHNN